MSREKIDKGITVMLPPSVLEKLRHLAAVHSRSLSGEARFALIVYIEEEEDE